MTEFCYKDKQYQFDSMACYNGPNMIRLPDGTILQVGGWFESYPPQPGDLQVVTFLPGTEPETTPATFAGD